MTPRKSKTHKTRRELVPIALLTGEFVPSEAWESARFVAWLERMQVAGHVELFSHIVNEQRSPSARLAAWKLGTRKGVPDYVVVLPGGQCVWVELKKVKRGKPSVEQLNWVKALAPHAQICYGADQGIRFVTQYFTPASAESVSSK